MPLRDYQADSVTRLRQAITAGRKAPLYVLPCGGGKTAVAAEIISAAKRKGRPVLFLAPRRELIYQVSERLEVSDIEHGIIMAGESVSQIPAVQVACIPTLHARCIQRKKLFLPKAGVVIVDEAHIGIGGRAQEILEHYRDQGAVVVGLTATPARSDGRGLDMVYDVMVQGPSVQWLIDNGYLVPPRYFGGNKPNLDGVKIQAGDYHQGQLGERVDEPVLIGDVVENWARLASDRQTFVFAVNRAHSRHLAERFQQIGIAAEHIDGNTEAEERKAIQQRLRDGKTQVIVNCQIMTYGVDFPPVSCIVLATPTKSVAKYMQMVGRGLRTHPGKQDCFVIDHAGVVAGPEAIGFVEDPMPWSLDGKSKIQDRKAAEPKEPREITCGECGTIFKAAHYCPTCGKEMAGEYKKAVEAFEAELVEIDRQRQLKAKSEWTMERKARFYGELKSYCRERGYSPGWSANQYRKKTGVWPNDPRVKHSPESEPTPETLAWIKSQQIRYAKRKEKQREAA